MEKITVFTPTYNRKEQLKQLYASLLRQTAKDFIWFIVDDGSTDKTKELVKRWISESKIPIKYCFQENSGKMVAHNRGVHLCTTDLFLCVDSDDYLVDNAIELILKHYEGICQEDSICGIVAYRSNSINSFPLGVEYSTLSDLYRKGFRGETTLVFKTGVLKRFLFPVIEGEKFITESYIYDQIDDSYKYFILREILTIARYQEDGYTKNILNIQYHNPKGYVLYYRQSLLRSKCFVQKLRNMAQYISFSLLSHYSYADIIKGCTDKFLCILSFPLGIYKNLLLKREYNKYLRKTSHS